MIGMNSYLNAYVDRRMKYIVEEWDLATKADLVEFTSRLAVLEQEIPRLKFFDQAASDKLTRLETQAAELKGRI
jgi:hypothetical protein